MGDNGTCGSKPPWIESFLHVRSSFARFSGQPVPDECLRRVLELARLAPTESYFQPWRWILIRSHAGKRVVESATQVGAPLSSAPVVLICLADTGAWKTAPQQIQELVAKKTLSAQSGQEILRRIREQYASSPELTQRAALAHAFIAVHQILIAAVNCDLSAYWVSAFDEQKIKAHFHIPDHFLVAALIGIGYAEKTVSPLPELPLQSHIYEETFGEAYESRDRD
jgi:nitroreductase